MQGTADADLPLGHDPQHPFARETLDEVVDGFARVILVQRDQAARDHKALNVGILCRLDQDLTISPMHTDAAIRIDDDTEAVTISAANEVNAFTGSEEAAELDRVAIAIKAIGADQQASTDRDLNARRAF